MTEETFVLRLVGGPWAGNRLLPPKNQRILDWSWPLPDEFTFAPLEEAQGIPERGLYRKVSESQLQPTEGVMRGALYQWVPEDGH